MNHRTAPSGSESDFHCSGAPLWQDLLLQKSIEGGESRMTIVKVIAIVAVAAASLSLGACASKPKPAPVSASYSK
jgi:hypothetical protein